MSHHRCCSCDQDSDLCGSFNIGTDQFCYSLNFSGVEKNPWVIQDGNCGDCALEAGFSVNSARGVIALAGINRSFSYFANDTREYPGLLAVRFSNHNCDAYEDGGVTYNKIRVGAAAQCINGVLTLVGVTATNEPFGGILFSWHGAMPIAGNEITVPNQLDCSLVLDGPNTVGENSMTGTCTVSISIVPESDPSPCSAADQDYYSIAENCSDASDRIIVDLATNTLSKPTPRLNGDVYRLTGETTTDAPVTVEWVDDFCQAKSWIVAKKCSNQDESISIDPLTATPGARTVLFQGERYFISADTTTDPPVTVVWSNGVCPVSSGDVLPTVGCESCAPGQPGWPECCNISIWQNCPGCLGAAAMAPPSSSHLRTTGLISEAELDAMGADPEFEASKAKQGGCCGQPSNQ